MTCTHVLLVTFVSPQFWFKISVAGILIRPQFGRSAVNRTRKEDAQTKNDRCVAHAGLWDRAEDGGREGGRDVMGTALLAGPP